MIQVAVLEHEQQQELEYIKERLTAFAFDIGLLKDSANLRFPNGIFKFKAINKWEV